MGNMSYCRFRNTARDLDECVDALENLMSTDADVQPLSSEELEGLQYMARLSFRLLSLLQEFGECDELEALDQIAYGHTLRLEQLCAEINATAEEHAARGAGGEEAS